MLRLKRLPKNIQCKMKQRPSMVDIMLSLWAIKKSKRKQTHFVKSFEKRMLWCLFIFFHRSQTTVLSHFQLAASAIPLTFLVLHISNNLNISYFHTNECEPCPQRRFYGQFFTAAEQRIKIVAWAWCTGLNAIVKVSSSGKKITDFPRTAVWPLWRCYCKVYPLSACPTSSPQTTKSFRSDLYWLSSYQA